MTQYSQKYWLKNELLQKNLVDIMELSGILTRNELLKFLSIGIVEESGSAYFTKVVTAGLFRFVFHVSVVFVF